MITDRHVGGSREHTMTVRDDALPTMAQVLDAAVVAPILQRSLGPGAPLPDVHVHCLRYKPGTNLVVHYDVGIDAAWHDAVIMVASSADLARRAANTENVRLARRVDGRSPAAAPLQYDTELDVLVQWLPLDLRLPALSESPSALRARLRAEGLRFLLQDSEPTLLNYKPRRRAALRVGGHVVKVYAGHDQFMNATTGLRTTSVLREINTPRFEAALPDLQLTVQELLSGRHPARALDVARDAGSITAALHASHLSELRVTDTMSQLRAAAASTRLVGSIAPRLRARGDTLLAALELARPPDLELVPSHGDFHAKQLLRHHGVLAVIDFDEICAAPAALDLATFAAHVVRGDTDDLAQALTALDSLAEGYGDRPDGLSWYLATSILRRAPIPFRYLDEQWPERMEGMMLAAETALAR